MKKEQLNNSYNEHNKGIIHVGEDIVWIIDEVRGIYDEQSSKLKNDTEWFITEWHNYLLSITHKHKQLLIEDIFNDGINNIKNKYYNLNKNCNILNIELPLASITLVRWNKNTAEYFILGDNQLWINKNNKIDTIMDNNFETINKLIFNNIKRIKEINNYISFDELNSYIKPTLIQNKSKANKKYGYWTLSFNKDCICNALHDKFSINDKVSMLLVNHGCSSIVNDYKFLSKPEVFETVEKYKLTSILNLIRSIENNDIKGQSYPRLKEHNNFSAIYLNFK